MTLTRTENHALSFVLKNKCLDFFSKIGGMRSLSREKKVKIFMDAAKEDPKTAVKILFWGRDARNGAGERKTFHDLAMLVRPEFIALNAEAIINYGYAKDLLEYFHIPEVVKAYADALMGKGKTRRDLVAKWAPRRGKKFLKLKDHMSITNKQMRTLLVRLSKTVEQDMSKKNYGEISYSSVPGAAMRKYQKAFKKHDKSRFNEWISDKDSKASVSATYPHDITKYLKGSEYDTKLCQKLWDNLPDLTSGDENPIVVADTSGSMSGLPMEVSVSLGIYCAEKLGGRFKDKVITFSSDPQFHDLSNYISLKDKWDYLWMNGNWSMNTDIQKVYELLLSTAKMYNVPSEQMPSMIVVISDMQFDEATDADNDPWSYTEREYIPKVSDTNHEQMKTAFELRGYKFPKLVYWNVRVSDSSPLSSPVHDISENTALISGFNPAILRPVLSGESLNPMKVMYDSLSHIDLDFTESPFLWDKLRVA